ncbi:DUF7144 family membrane protein [Streptomyces roseicoloratus]|uniref:DUF7144 family membrane protein n=1 Tax=Streptomyces roseicoloratus TaxID=2508722 RepID=UPI001009B3F2|nr:hypothetical protein [Streptomyces roseicoloratus]
MSQNTTPPRPSPTPARDDGWAAGGTIFAGVLMTVIGVLDVFQGIAAIAEDDVYARVGDYVFKFDLTSWGWIHLCLGVVVMIVGFGVLKGAAWARIAGIALASLNIVLQFLFLPYQPWWALFSMAVSIFVVWALATDGSYGRNTAV